MLIDYSVWLITTDRLRSVDSVRNYLSAVRTLCKMYGHDCPTPKSHWSLDWTLVGIRRELQFPPQRKKPISPDILYNLITRPSDLYTPLQTLSWEKQVLLTTIQVVYIVAFFSMLRASNIVPKSHKKVDKKRLLTWSKLRRHSNGVVCRILLSLSLIHI